MSARGYYLLGFWGYCRRMGCYLCGFGAIVGCYVFNIYFSLLAHILRPQLVLDEQQGAEISSSLSLFKLEGLECIAL